MYNEYVTKRISEWSKLLTVDMKCQSFDATELISISSFFSNFYCHAIQKKSTRALQCGSLTCS